MAVMKKFEASSASVMVNGETILAFVKAVPSSVGSRLETLKKYGIDNPQPGKFYSQQSWLNAFKEVAEKIGPTTLRLIGKLIPANAQFPPQIKDAQTAFESLNTAYQMNHKGGEIGYYKLVSFDLEKKTLIMEVNTPYPEDFDSGILLGLFDKFKPKGVIRQPELLKERRSTGVLVYTLTW